MMAVFSDARAALTGVFRMLIGRPDFHGLFDVSSAGVWRSFLAAILAIPFAALAAGVQNALAKVPRSALDPMIEPFSFAFVVANWVGTWAYFPLLAAAVTWLLRKREGFAPWVVVHNWTHLFVATVAAVPLLLLVVGAPALADVLYVVAIVVAIYAYVRAAKATLDVPWLLAVGLGAADWAGMLLVQMTLRKVL
jgi:hypothetical protein